MADDAAGKTDSAGSRLPDSLEGHFLVSETELVDPNFYRTVVLMITHNDDGAFGLVVNRPADLSLSDIVPEFEDDAIGEHPAYVGGPVEQQFLFALHSGLPERATSPYASRPAPGVIFEPVFTVMEEYLHEEWGGVPVGQQPSMHFFLGYAGWAPGQLERELQEKAWLVIPATAEIVFHPHPEEGWNDALSRKGGLYRIVAQTGFKPSMN